MMDEQYVGSEQWREDTANWHEARAMVWLFSGDGTVCWWHLFQAEFARQEGLGV